MGLPGAVVGAGLGLVNHNQQKAEYNRQKELAAQQEALSPWTGVHGQMPAKNPNLFSSVLQGGLSGATMGAGGGIPGLRGAAGAAGAGANPMAGATQMGGGEGLSPMGQQMNQGNNMFSGPPSQSSWSQVPTLYGPRNQSPYSNLVG